MTGKKNFLGSSLGTSSIICDCNHGQDMWRLFHVLAQNFIQQKWIGIRLLSPKDECASCHATKRLKTKDLKKLGNFKKILGMLGIDA